MASRTRDGAAGLFSHDYYYEGCGSGRGSGGRPRHYYYGYVCGVVCCDSSCGSISKMSRSDSMRWWNISAVTSG